MAHRFNNVPTRTLDAIASHEERRASAIRLALDAAGTRAGIHGDSHWRRVAEAGLIIAQRERLDRHVILLFAIFHDCRRENEGHDPGHGPRAAALAEQIGHSALAITLDEMRQLSEALHDHDRGLVSEDLVIGACWDADRLDLNRVGIALDSRYLSTPTGREPSLIAFCIDYLRPVPSWPALARGTASGPWSM